VYHKESRVAVCGADDRHHQWRPPDFKAYACTRMLVNKSHTGFLLEWSKWAMPSHAFLETLCIVIGVVI
jgi:hypothetical protein